MENSCLGVGKSLTKREKYSESAIFMSVEIDTNLTLKSSPAILLKSIKINLNLIWCSTPRIKALTDGQAEGQMDERTLESKFLIEGIT